MRIRKIFFFISLIILCMSLTAMAMAGGHGAKGAPKASIVPGGDTINISGIILDSHKETIGEAFATPSARRYLAVWR